MKKFLTLSNKRGVALLVIATFILSIVTALFGQAIRQPNERMWSFVDESSLDQSNRVLIPMVYRTVRLDEEALLQALSSAPMEFTGDASRNPIISLPMPDGTMARFRFEHSPVVEPGLAAKYPELNATYRAQGIDDPAASCRFDLMLSGFHAIILSPSGTVLIDPYAQGETTNYITYWKRDAANLAQPWGCEFNHPELPPLPDQGTVPPPAVISGTTLRTYRLALAATNEYAVVAGSNTVSGTLAAEVVIMNRVNGVYERDVAIHMNIVANNNLITYAGDNNGCGGPCNSSNDPYSNGDGSTMLGQNQTTCNTVIGSANYDIGHVFSTGGGGVAQLGVPCGSSKARGVTGQPSPFGDPFAIDYVAHEMGHQFGANHTFNGASGNCGGNRSGTHAYEPGSGITIMAYAGICQNQDLAAHSIDTFHIDSLNAIVAFTQGGAGDACDVPTATGNTPPTISGPGNFSIPIQTPFSLTASATDPNGDSITYDWQEFDLGASTTAVPNTDATGAKPIFRSYLPTSSGTRFFPSLQYILSNANVPPSTNGSCPTAACLTGELLPTISRTMVFQVVARDNRANGGGINSTSSTLTVTNTSGPFAVTAPNTAITILGGTNFSVTWNVANTTAAPVSAANVKISLSTDGGNTFPTVLLASTPNDGSQSVLIPNTPTSVGRIKIEGVGNIFFDISDTNFSIGAPSDTPTPTPIPTPTPTITPTPTPGLSVTVSLPVANVSTAVTNFTQPVTTTDISGGDNLVGFQGDFTFDSSIITFQNPPISGSGLTGTNWNVTGNIIGAGTVKTLRISAFSNDFTPLSGSGTLFQLNLTRVSSTPGASTPLIWAAPPGDFYFIDADLNNRPPSSTPSGSLTIQGATINISGTMTYCSNPTLPPVANAALILTGDASSSTVSNGSGNYILASIPSGGNYTVTPSKATLTSGSTGIDTVDVVAIQRHFLALGVPLSGCRLTAADVNGLGGVDTVDVIATQRFFLAFSTGIANVGKYNFSPANRTYAAPVTDQTAQNYNTLVFGDVVTGFVH